MGLDDLVRLLFVLAFLWPFVAGLFNRKAPKGQQRKAAPKRNPQNQPRRGAGSAQRQTASTQPKPPAAVPAGEPGTFEKRLEEARRRVREAMGEDSPAQPEASSGNLFKESPRRSLLESPQPTSQRTGFLPPDSLTARPAFAEESKALQVKRLGKRRRAAQRGKLLEFSSQSILKGLVWQQILSEPKAKQSKARQSKARQSDTEQTKPRRRTP